jgi:hypothetical protein
MMSFATRLMSRFYVALRAILPIWCDRQSALRSEIQMIAMVQSQLRLRAELLLAGRLGLVVRDYRIPLLVQLGPDRLLIRTQNEALSILAVLRQALLARRVVAMLPKVTAIDLPKNGRFRVWVDWQELAVPVDGTRLSSTIYYCRQTPGGMRTEMVEYTRLSMPELNQQFAALALSA